MRIVNSEPHTHMIVPDEPPAEIREWLSARGWQCATYCSHSKYDVHSFSWEQAVAFEAYKFLTIGGHRG